MAGHAPLAPSAAHRWLRCPASVSAERGFPDKSSPEADEGSALHEVRARCLRLGHEPFDYIGDLFLGGTRRLTECTQELLSHLYPGIERIDDLCGDLDALRSQDERYVMVEVRLRYEDRALKDVYGTLDFGAYLRSSVVISDLKFGKGVPVFATNNEQQLIYAGLYLDALTRAERRRIKDIRIVIDQPRIHDAGGEWLIEPSHLERWMDEVLYPGVEAVNSRNPKYDASPKACFWCKAKPTCAAFQDHNINTLGISFDDERDKEYLGQAGLRKMSPEMRSYIVLHKKMIEDFVQMCHDSALEDALAGRPTPLLKVVDGRQGKRKWRNDSDAEDVLKNLLGEKAYARSVISPTTAEKLLPRKAWGAIQERHVERAPIVKKLVPKSDERESVVKQIEFSDERENDE